MACSTFKNDRFIWLDSANTLSLVADETARDGISTPASGDGAWLKDPGRYDTYASSWQDDQTARPITDFSLSSAFDETDTTDSETAGTAKDIISVRHEDTLTTTGVLYSSTEGISGKDLGFTFNSVDYKATDVSYTRAYDIVNCTNSTTTTTLKEFTYDRYEASGTATLIMTEGTAAPVTGSQQTGTVEFDGSNVKISGTMEIISCDHTGSRGDKNMYSISYRIIGAVTETGVTNEYEDVGAAILVIAPAHGYQFNSIFKESFSMTANVEGDATRTDTWRINGGFTEFIS